MRIDQVAKNPARVRGEIDAASVAGNAGRRQLREGEVALRGQSLAAAARRRADRQ
jgi:hypothetical protein